MGHEIHTDTLTVPTLSAPPGGPYATIDYESFYDGTYRMDVWLGDHVALLVPEGTVVDATVMDMLVGTFDTGYETYMSFTGRTPEAWDPYTFEGRGTIAVVAETCGAGCGYLGRHGIEILDDMFGAGFDTLWPWINGVYDAIADSGAIMDIVFYELGRNFWFYGDALGGYNFPTGYAVANRYIAGEATGYPWDATANEPAFYETVLPAEMMAYFSDDSITPEAVGKAGIYQLFYEHAGMEGYTVFWDALSRAYPATTVEEAFGNFAWAANEATGLSWGWLTKDDWQFVVGTADADSLQPTVNDRDISLVLLGFGGDDTIRSFGGNDLLFGDTGNDVLIGRNGDDQLAGGSGDDSLKGGNGEDILSGADGNDVLKGGGDGDLLMGGSDDDVLTGGAGSDALRGGDGDDTLRGGSGGDRLTGGHGEDVLTGGGGDDTLIGGPGTEEWLGPWPEDWTEMLRDGVRDEFRITGNAGTGNDTIEGFELGVDVLRFKQVDIVTAEQAGDDVLLDTTLGGTVLVTGVTLEALADDIVGTEYFGM
ncbi:calcium-binding protein [Tropicimonas marinistellae]|uniref:calcium-binding protein n=1 Tax=Tropicimonas marinistellae TaxID=1739787 RepID=UPI00082AE627|nr:calcium-binding protein [Tropicimonas marinistellae]